MLGLEVRRIDKWKLQRYMVQFSSESCFKKKDLKHGFFFLRSRVSVYLLMINQQGCMASKWVFECAASFFPLSLRSVPEMEKIRH